MCYDEGILQELLDGEYQGDSRPIWNHIETCPECKARLENLKRQDTEIMQALAIGRVDEKAAQKEIETHQKYRELRRKPKMKKIHWTVKAAAAAVLVGGLVFTAPGAALAEQFLNIFRTEDVKAIAISPDDLSELGHMFEKGGGSLNIDNIGRFESTSKGDSKHIDLLEDPEQVNTYLPGAKIMPLKDSYKYGSASFNPETEVQFTLSVPSVNELLKSMGSKGQFPNSLDGKTFSITAGKSVTYDIEQSDGKGHFFVAVSEMPEIGLPKGVEMKELVEVMKDSGLLPNKMAEKIAGIEGLETVIPVPYVEGQETREETTIAGNKVIVIQDKENDHFRIFMKADQYLYVFSGYDMSVEDAKNMIETME